MEGRGAPRGPPWRAIFLGSLHFPSRREPFAWQINDDSVFLKGRAELIISPITWSGLVEIYSYHLPRTLKILRVMKGPPPAAGEPWPPSQARGAGRAPQHGARARERAAPSAEGPGWLCSPQRAQRPLVRSPSPRPSPWYSIHTVVLMYWWAREEPLGRRRAEDNHKMCLNI